MNKEDKELIKSVAIISSIPISFTGYIIFISYLFHIVIQQTDKIIVNIHNPSILLISSFLPYLFFGVGIISILMLYINVLTSESK